MTVAEGQSMGNSEDVSFVFMIMEGINQFFFHLSFYLVPRVFLKFLKRRVALFIPLHKCRSS